MFDLSWGELLIIGIVALIVVGPKELPMLFRKVGQFVGRMRGLAREFSSAMNQAADESGVRDVAKGLQAAANPVQSTFDGIKSSATNFSLDPESNTGKLAADRKAKAEKLKADAEARRVAAAQANAISAQAEFAAPASVAAKSVPGTRFARRSDLAAEDTSRNRSAARTGVSRARGTKAPTSKPTTAARAALKRRAGKPASPKD